MRKITLALLILLSVSTLVAGCGVKQKIQQKIGESIVEKVVEDALSDENAKVDIDGGKITIEGKDGESFSFGAGKWPDVDYIPEFKKGKIISTSKDEKDSIAVIFEEVAKKDIEDYVKNIKKDFTEETYEVNSDDSIVFNGKNYEGARVHIQYFINDKSLTIIGSRSE